MEGEGVKGKGITKEVKGTVRYKTERKRSNRLSERKSRVEIGVVDMVVNSRN
jgi:hypothetical protein